MRRTAPLTFALSMLALAPAVAAPDGDVPVLKGYQAKARVSCNGEQSAGASLELQPDGRFVLAFEDPKTYVADYRKAGGGRLEPVFRKADTGVDIQVTPRPRGPDLELELRVQVRRVTAWEQDASGPWPNQVPKVASCMFVGHGLASRTKDGWRFRTSPSPEAVQVGVDITAAP